MNLISNLEQKATYINHPNLSYRGNPYIEAIGYPLSQDAFMDAVNIPFLSECDLSSAPEHSHGYYQRLSIDTLSHSYVVRSEAYKLYDKLLRMIETGYARRNPLSPERLRLLIAIEKDKTDLADSKNFFSSFHINSLNLVDEKLCTFIAGLSGVGKTTMLKHILKLLPPILHHENELITRPQVVYLYVEVLSRNTQKPILFSILEALDSVTGDNYEERHKRNTVPELITVVRKAVIIHGIGLIIIDEAQNLAKSSKSDSISANERISMKFVESLFNRIGVPLCFVGTMYMLELFSGDMTMARRATITGSLILLGCDVESLFWERFIKEMCPLVFLKNAKNQPMDMEKISFHIHYLTAGIPAIASSLIRETLSYLTFLMPDDQYLSIAVLDKVFNNEFSILRPAIQAIKNKKYSLYDDLEPIVLLKEINKNQNSLEESAAEYILSEQSTSKSKDYFNDSQSKFEFANKDEEQNLVEHTKKKDALNTNKLLSNLGYGE